VAIHVLVWALLISRGMIQKNLKTILATFVVTAWAASALAVPTLLIQDGGGINAINTSLNGVVTVSSSDGFWTVVVTTGVASPPALGMGTPMAPTMDLSITAISANGSQNNPLSIFFAADEFGPTSGAWIARMTGQLVAGTDPGVAFRTYYNTANVVSSLTTPLPAGSTLLTDSGNLPGPNYANTRLSDPVTLGSPYSLIESVTISGGSVGGQYSLDASLVTVPDGGTTAMLLGAALSVLSVIRRKLT
jgi:hypothetical protein